MSKCDYPRCREESGIRLANIDRELCWGHYTSYCEKRGLVLLKLGVETK